MVENHHFEPDLVREKGSTIKAGCKRACQPPDIFVFDFTNGVGDVNKTESLKLACVTNGNLNGFDEMTPQQQPGKSINTGHQSGELTLVNPSSSSLNNKTLSPNCQPSQEMLWC